MPPKPKKNRDDFQIPNKHRIKLQKRDRKEQLRHKSAVSRNLIQSPQNSDDDEYQQKLLSKGSQWWHKVNHRFFRDLQETEVSEFAHRTKGQELLHLKYPAKHLQNYLNEELATSNQLIANPALLRVLFRKEIKLEQEEYNQIVTFTYKHYSEPRETNQGKPSSNIHLSSLTIPPQNQTESTFPQEMDYLDLEIIDIQQNQQQILKFLHHDVSTTQHQQLNREIHLWQHEIQQLAQRNTHNWQMMLSRRKEHSSTPLLEQELAHVKKELRMAEVLLYFKRGHSDKTQQMLQQALQVARIREMSGLGEQRCGLTRIEQLKQLFETDCKICFCTQSQDKNRVVYCDGCNTSFHQACYGVQELGQQKFFCEVCQYLQSNTTQDRQGLTRSPKKPSCRLCGKLNFPMRKLQDHFYHVTCLVLFDMVQIRNEQMQFKKGITHQSLLEEVVNNEINSEYCIYCLKDTGMKFKCTQTKCKVYFHPICAYLNGVVFDLERSYRSLTAKLTCPEHFPQRNSVNQIYLRRFFCDYNCTSKLNDLEFEVRFKEENEKRTANLQQKLQQKKLGVLRQGKLSKTQKHSTPKPKQATIEKSQA